MEKLLRAARRAAASTSSWSTRRRPATRSTSSTRRAGSPACSTTASSACSWCRPVRTLRVGSVAAQAFLRTVSKVVGTEVGRRRRRVLPRVRGDGGGLPRPGRGRSMQLLADRRDRVRARDRRRGATRSTRRSSSRTGSPRRVSAVDALVVNRVHRQFSDVDAGTRCGARARRSSRAESGRRAPRRPGSHRATTNLADFEDVAGRERRRARRARGADRRRVVAHVPELGHDVHDFTALARGRRPPVRRGLSPG